LTAPFRVEDATSDESLDVLASIRIHPVAMENEVGAVAFQTAGCLGDVIGRPVMLREAERIECGERVEGQICELKLDNRLRIATPRRLSEK
jgi:hypothetical protein